MKESRLHGTKFLAFLESKMDFSRWEFRLTHSDFSRNGVSRAIYDSELCRVDFDLYNERYGPENDELHVQYGRLHAPDTEAFIVWNGEKCRCWHYSIFLPVLFLEGFTPEEVASRKAQEGSLPLPPILAAQEQSEANIELRQTYPPAAVLAREALIWDHYGVRFFELFDLREADLWDSYRRFVEEYYRLRPRRQFKGDTSPPDHKIC